MRLHFSIQQNGSDESHSFPKSGTKEQSAWADVLALVKNILVTPHTLSFSLLEMKLPQFAEASNTVTDDIQSILHPKNFRTHKNCLKIILLVTKIELTFELKLHLELKPHCTLRLELKNAIWNYLAIVRIWSKYNYKNRKLAWSSKLC